MGGGSNTDDLRKRKARGGRVENERGIGIGICLLSNCHENCRIS